LVALVPLALGAVLFALVSSRDSLSLPRPRRHNERGARWARRKDLHALVLDHRAPHPGRLALGTVHGVVRPALVVAERAQSVVVVGPTQSGKTTALAVPAILGWGGPVVAASVKSDLLRDTRNRRNERGRIWCIDPTGSTGMRASRWSPLTPCVEWAAARRAAADLAETAKADGTTADGEFWYATAAKLLAPLFCAAARDGRQMADVVRWIDTQEASEVSLILEEVGVAAALDAARASWCRDERTRSSVYTTAETILAPFADAGNAPGAAFEPPDLLGGPHTLYLCAPAHDQRRLRGYFSALTQQVLAHAFAQATRAGKPLEPPLLVVLDEAAHIAPLPELDGLAATCASRDPAGDRVAGPGPGARPLRLQGSDGAEQPQSQGLSPRDRRSRHVGLCQPPHRRRRDHRAVDHPRSDRRPIDYLEPRAAPAVASGGSALSPPR
jgi:type IV secretion system protein VirD4